MKPFIKTLDYIDIDDEKEFSYHDVIDYGHGWEFHPTGPSADGTSFIKNEYVCQILCDDNVYVYNLSLDHHPNLVIWKSIDYEKERIFLGHCNNINDFKIITEKYLKII